MSRGFVPVEKAVALYNLHRKGGASLVHYPKARTWRNYRAAGSVTESLERLFHEHPSVLLVGPPKTGKTFDALLFGHKWRESLSWWQRQFRPRWHAYYASSGELELSAVIDDLWPEINRKNLDFAQSLWIVDDIHQDIAACVEILQAFKRYELGDAGHRLLFVGWSKPEEFSGLPTVPVSLSPESIRLAMLAAELAIPKEDVLRGLAEQPLGILEILWAGKNAPELLERPQELQQAWIDDYCSTAKDAQVAPTLVVDLARLGFLGLTHPGGDLQTRRDLKRLSDLGLARVGPSGEGWGMSDELARAVLRRELVGHDFNEGFFEPLRLIVVRAPALALPISAAMRHRKVIELEEWLGSSSSANSQTRTLLAEFLKVAGPTLRESLLKVECRIADAARFVATCSTGQDVTSWAKDVVSVKSEQIRNALSAGSAEEWRAVVSLSRFAQDSTLDELLLPSAARTEFLESLRDMPPTLRGAVLLELRKLSPEACRNVERKLLPKDPNELARKLEVSSTDALWRTLERVVSLEPGLALNAITLLDKRQIAAAAIRSPGLCLSALKRVGKQHLDTQMLDTLTSALRGIFPTNDDVLVWTQGHDLERFVVLADQLQRPDLLEVDSVFTAADRLVSRGTPAQVVDLSYSVARLSQTRPKLTATIARSLEKRIEAEAEVGNPYLYAMIHIDRARAEDLMGQGLRRLLEVRQGLQEENTFTLFLNSVTALTFQNRETLGQLAELIVSCWEPGNPTPPAHIALAGLIAYERHGPPPGLVLEATPCDEIRARAVSPTQAMSQFYAVAAMPNIDSVAVDHLTGLTDAISRPTEEFKKRWHRLHPRIRRHLLRMVLRALGYVKEDNRTEKLATVLTAASTSPEVDDIWDDDIPTRFRLSLWDDDWERAAQLSRRCQKKWLAKLGKGHLRGNSLVRLLVGLIALASRKADALPTVKVIADTLYSRLEQEPIAIQLAATGLRRLLEAKPMYQGVPEILNSGDPLVRILVASVTGIRPNELDIVSLQKYITATELQLIVPSLE